MTEKEFEIFLKRYDEFKDNNLPTPFWDSKRNSFEYVDFYNKDLNVNTSISEAFSDIISTSLYYPFTNHSKENDSCEYTINHTHVHSFDKVVRALYDFPESFKLEKEDKQYYSMQELNYLRRLQKYLLFIGLKDIEVGNIPDSRYINKKQDKYEGAYIHEYSDELINDIKNKTRDFVITDWHSGYHNEKEYEPNEYRALIVDSEDNFKLFVEYTKAEVKTYKDIKNIIKDNKYNDNDKVVLKYFKVIEIFE